MKGLFWMIGYVFSSDVRYNYGLERDGIVDESNKVYTNIRPDLGLDDSTSSGFVEVSTPINDEEE